MEIRRGNIVFSKAGRDKGYPLVVTDLCEGYAFVADGGMRKLENPKKKKLKHLQKTNFVIVINFFAKVAI